ncbi:MAG: V-type ATP synthase subunit K [Clostridia bacterium]|nr:V-type ATP synthase subunit K [Clostridia bacterium]MDE6677225.1 V-type ATP synthase subunit K [Clostridia bacterium]
MISSLLAEGEQAASGAGAGFAIAMVGVALCVILCGIGSALGLYKTGTAAAGVLSEAPKKFGKVFMLVLLPATQGLYGFVIGIIASGSIAPELSMAQGWAMFGAVMPMAISGLITGIFQGKSSANCIYAAGKQDSLSFKLVIYPAMIEFYAILGLVISIMLLPLV